jgi:RNA-directed DNA polymerase
MKNFSKNAIPSPDRVHELRAALACKIASFIGPAEKRITDVPGLLLTRRTATTAPASATYEPSLAVVAQGRKRASLGGTTFIFDQSRYLLTSLDLPVICNVIEASEAVPYLSFVLKLEIPVVRELLSREEIQGPEATTEGTPQGGIISPALANCALDGLERLLKEKFPTKKPLSSLGGKVPCVNLIRYADDFVITGRTKELLEGKIKPLVEQFLQKRGLELSPTKTVITHVEQGFDFLGQNVRKYPCGKLLIKPSKKNVKTFLEGIRGTIKAALGISAADLIDWLNPKIRGWSNYHRHVVSARVFSRVDYAIFIRLWQWTRRRHPKKSSGWLKQKYFQQHGGNNWTFFGESCDDEGKTHKVRLLLASSTPIQRYVKIKSAANPYDPAQETYFEKREGDYLAETFRGTRTLRFLWKFQRGFCPVCNTKITRITGWRIHYCVPRVMGGSTNADNRVLVHPECHDRVHRQHLSVLKPRLPERGVRRT